MSEYSQIQAKLINVLNRKVIKHKTVYKLDNNIILIDGKDKYYYTIHRMGNTNMGILIPSNIDNTKANCWYIVGKNLFDGGGNPDIHEYVDLGLPSGTLWASDIIRNENGEPLYFAWGETQGYTSGQVGTDKNFTWKDYKYGNGTSNPGAIGMTKYNSTDTKTVLDAEDDAATINWGSSWKMPSKEQFDELDSNTVKEITESGIVLTSSINGNSLIIKEYGYANSGTYHGGIIHNWTSSLYTEDVRKGYRYVFQNSAFTNGNRTRYTGSPVLPVRVNN